MRMLTGSLHRCALLAVAGLLVLTACADPPQRAGTLPSSAPSTTKITPTPTSPEEQVEAAVRAYYAELTRAAQTNDTSRLKSMVTRGCPCYRPIRVIERGAVRGEITPDAKWTITSIRVHDIEGDSAAADVTYRVNAYDVIDDAGEVVGRVNAQRSRYDLSLVHGPDGWVIGNVFNLEG